jgi:hypothetical protein
MRHVREILNLSLDCGLLTRVVSGRVGVGPTTFSATNRFLLLNNVKIIVDPQDTYTLISHAFERRDMKFETLSEWLHDNMRAMMPTRDPGDRSRDLGNKAEQDRDMPQELKDYLAE